MGTKDRPTGYISIEERIRMAAEVVQNSAKSKAPGDNILSRLEGTKNMANAELSHPELLKQCREGVIGKNIQDAMLVISAKAPLASEVESKIAEMSSVATAGIVIPHVAQQLLTDAIEMLTNLSAKKEVPLPEDVTEMASWLLGQSDSCPKDEENHGSDWIRNMKARDEKMKKAAEMITNLSAKKEVPLPEEVQKLVNHLNAWKLNDCSHSHGRKCGEAAEMIANLSAKKLVTGSINGGVLSMDACDGVEFDVRDYDIEGSEEDELLDEDEHGRYFQAG